MEVKQIEALLNSAQAKYEDRLSKLSSGNVILFPDDIVLCKWSGYFLFKQKIRPVHYNRQILGSPDEFLGNHQLSGDYNWPSEALSNNVLSKFYGKEASFINDSKLSFTGEFHKVSTFEVTSDSLKDLVKQLIMSHFIPSDWDKETRLVCDLISFLTINKLADYDENGIHIFSDSVNETLRDIVLKYGLTLDLPQDDMPLADKLLDCDKIRINEKRYPEELLLDANQGHWDLEQKVKVANEKIYHPRKDIFKDIRNGYVGIDFGTRSTIVCYQDKNNITLPLPIGGSDVEKEEKNENPTIMEFVALNRFMNSYNKKSSRPDTRWADLKISHSAKTNFDEAGDLEYNAFLDNLKQWAGGRDNEIKIVPKKEDGKPYDLKSFLDIEDGDWNPIEYYAYMIGQFVNNLDKGIHLNYYLSVPVKYESKVKEKLRECFERGLRKSLPKAILEDPNSMKKFFVRISVKDSNKKDLYLTEPLAYAVCALQEYRIDPEEKTVNYAVFDMGGGTLDYDFGIWSTPDDEDDGYNFKIHTFGGSGMPVMGGENILEDLAFEIFKENLQALEKDSQVFQFAQGPTSAVFAEGFQFLNSRSIYAKRNSFKLKSYLRPYWEKAQVMLIEAKDKDKELTINLQLQDTNGDFDTCELKTTVQFIEDFFRAKIKEAIGNFFDALAQFKSRFDTNEIKLFLAGKSCYSPLVREIFDDRIREFGDEYIFDIFAPLGSPEAISYMECNNISYNKNITGKTGVAFGLIDCGSRIIQIESDAEEKFGYYLGKNSKFKTFKPIEFEGDGKASLGVWFKYKNVKEGDDHFDVYYTDLPTSLNGDLDITKTTSVKCFFDEYSGDNSSIYVRASGPHTLEYTISDDEPKDNYRGQVYTKEL